MKPLIFANTANACIHTPIRKAVTHRIATPSDSPNQQCAPSVLSVMPGWH